MYPGQSGHVIESKVNGTSCRNSTFIVIPRPWPVFWTSCGLSYFTWDPVLRPIFLHNFSEFIQDSLAMLLNLKPLAYHAAVLALLSSAGHGQFFRLDTASQILPWTLSCGPNNFIILANLFGTVWPCY